MFEQILRQLTIWRNETARREGVELFRVLPNKTLEEVALKCPVNKTELIAISGIKEAKFQKYGREIIKIVKANAQESENEKKIPAFVRMASTQDRGSDRVFAVGEYLDVLNGRLIDLRAKIKGEISSVDERERAVYFSLKDKDDESVINCFIFRYQYDTLGVKLEEGMEIIVEGYPEIYKPYGRLSLRVSSIELEGEGLLKKEYEELKKKLEEAGLFALENKKKFVGLPQKIGLITSREGAAIGDFTSNIGQFGLNIRFINSSVEGRRAVFELIEAIRTFRKSDIDALVIIRGGGSLESLQAFNNEALLLESKKLKVPVICGVGHDRDISLLSLTSDYSVSTPTAAARLIGGLWEKEIDRIDYFEKNIAESFEIRMNEVFREIKDASFKIDTGFKEVLRNTEEKYENFLRKNLEIIEDGLEEKGRMLDDDWKKMSYAFAAASLRLGNQIEKVENVMKLNDPARQLRLGYGIVSKNGASIRSVSDMRVGETVKIRVFDGEAQSEIKTIKKFNK